jgi:hypothetical protein
MDKRKSYTKINYLKNHIKYNSLSGSKENMFQFCKNNGTLHEDTKYEVFKFLIKKNNKVYSEVEFKDGNRADLISFDEKGNGYIFEIVNGESPKSIQSKLDRYDIDFELFFIYCNKPIKEQILI